MPDYLDDPSVLTKDKLKSELLAHNVELPSGNPTKDVYVQLYLKNLTQQNHNQVPAATLDLFSSDEELPPPVVSSRSRSSGRKATRKTDKIRPDEMDVTTLSDEGLKGELLKHGVEAGPIVASTRKLYEKKLQRLLDDGPAQPKLVVTEIQVNHNGNSESDLYSDKEDEVVAPPEPEPAVEPEPEPEPAPVVERPVRSRGKTAVTTRTHSSSSQHQTREQLMDEEEDDDDEEEEEEEVLQVKRKSRRLSRRMQIVPEVLRPVLTSQIQLESDKRVYHRRDSPARAEPPTITSRPAQLKVEDLRLSLPKPGKDSSPQPAALLDTALLEEPEPCIDPVRPAAPRPQSAARPSRLSSPLVLLSRVDPVSFSPRCGDSPIKRPEPSRSVTDHIGSHTPDARVARVEKIAASEQITNVEQSEVLKELFPNDINSPTGISATCRRPIRGAARRPVKYSDLWNDENRLFSPKTSKTTLSSSTTSTSYRESCTANRVASLPPSASPFSTAVSSSSSRLVSAAPPAGQPKAAYRSVSLWIKLFLLAVVAAFLFLVYQAMETNTINPFAAPNTDVASGSTA